MILPGVDTIVRLIERQRLERRLHEADAEEIESSCVPCVCQSETPARECPPCQALGDAREQVWDAERALLAHIRKARR